jgi:hypothetical protein
LTRCSSTEYVTSVVPESVQLGGTNRFFRKDLQQELYNEVKRVRTEIRLHECDRELYMAYVVCVCVCVCMRFCVHVCVRVRACVCVCI